MTTTQDVIVVDIMQSIVAAMRVQNPLQPAGTFLEINYVPGRVSQIMKNLIQKDETKTLKGKKYPLIALQMPVKEPTGNPWIKVVIDRIVIATLTNGYDSVLRRYEPGGTFKSILYPCYNELISQICRSIYTVGQDPVLFPHTRMANPGEQPAGQGSVDFIDSIEILNLTINFNQLKTC